MSDTEQIVVSLTDDRRVLLFARANVVRPERSTVEMFRVACGD